jgi:hypothetical protein
LGSARSISCIIENPDLNPPPQILNADTDPYEIKMKPSKSKKVKRLLFYTKTTDEIKTR